VRILPVGRGSSPPISLLNLRRAISARWLVLCWPSVGLPPSSHSHLASGVTLLLPRLTSTPISQSLSLLKVLVAFLIISKVTVIAAHTCQLNDRHFVNPSGRLAAHEGIVLKMQLSVQHNIRSLVQVASLSIDSTLPSWPESLTQHYLVSSYTAVSVIIVCGAINCASGRELRLR
jgi:hypothetical protein